MNNKPASFLLLVVVLASLTACGSSEDEMALRDNIREMREAITSHQADVFMKQIDANYKSPLHRDKNTLGDFIDYYLTGNRVIHIYLADINIEIDDASAKITFYSGVAGGPDQIPERGRLFKVGTHWLKTSGQWKLTQAKWRPALIPKN